MSKQKKSSRKNNLTQQEIVLATAIIGLITAAFNLIDTIIKVLFL